MVAESDLEAETAKPVDTASNVQRPDEYLSKPEVFVNNATTGSAGSHETFQDGYSSVETRKDKVNESDNRNLDIIFNQNLIVRHVTEPSTIVTAEDGGVTNFKRFRKVLASECIIGAQITASY